MTKPNLLYVFGDQWRFCDHGYAGNREVQTPRIDEFAARSVNFKNAVSGIPVCCPHRASLITGKHPLSHGLYLNDIALTHDHRTIAHCLNDAGYHTGWVGKWHIDGRGRESFTPPERRQGFRHWRALECTHDYHHSPYYADTPEKKHWNGYDAIDQTRHVQGLLEAHANREDANPFALFLSWGPPHAPYETAPEEFKALYAERDLTLRPNVPETDRDEALELLRGYYAHIAALDRCFGELMATLEATGLAENTIVVYTSDHGDMLRSQGERKKQRPWEESLRVPFLLRWPKQLRDQPREIAMPLDTPDIMPTLLGLCAVDIPQEVEGLDRSGVVLGTQKPDENHAALLTCPSPFGQFLRSEGGREYRGVRTARHTYCRDLAGPWLLYDNQTDPFQLNNLVGQGEHAELQNRLDALLQERLRQTRDEFLPGPELIRRSGYVVDDEGTVDYEKPFHPANVAKSPLG